MYNSLMLISSSYAILNSPVNSFCPLDTALVLTSDNFHSIFPPSPLFLSTSCLAPTLEALIRNCHVALSLPCVHIHLFSFDWERHRWLSKGISEASLCLSVLFIRKSLHFFLVRVSSVFHIFDSIFVLNILIFFLIFTLLYSRPTCPVFIINNCHYSILMIYIFINSGIGILLVTWIILFERLLFDMIFHYMKESPELFICGELRLSNGRRKKEDWNSGIDWRRCSSVQYIVRWRHLSMKWPMLRGWFKKKSTSQGETSLHWCTLLCCSHHSKFSRTKLNPLVQLTL